MKKALEALPGVANVKTDTDAETATCKIEAGKFDSENAITVLADLGYEGGKVLE